MTVKLKDVPGLLLNKKHVPDNWPEECADDGWNEVVDLQGERSLTLNRERLAKVMYLEMNREGNWDELDVLVKHVFLARADAVIAALPEILEVSHE